MNFLKKNMKKKINNAALTCSLPLKEEQYADFQQHAKDIREEWNGGISLIILFLLNI
jgi:hypothetical protein